MATTETQRYEGPSSTLSHSTLRQELLLVLALSLAASAVGALVSFVASLTAHGDLASHQATLNGSQAPGRPWLDLVRQLFDLAVGLVPVLLVAHLLRRDGASLASLGFDLRHKRSDLARGAAVAAVIGGAGLLLYLGSRAAGFNLTVVPSTLPDVWWRVPVLICSALQNAVLEEVIVLGYLVRRLTQLGWNWPATMLVSAALRGSYHFYQGVGGFLGNLAMGVVFCWMYRRWARVGPLAAAHALIDIVAFVGFVLLVGRVSWLPG